MQVKATINKWPFQIRDSFATAQATLSNGTAATLMDGDASNFLDLIHVTFANSSTVAGNTANIVLKQDGTTVKTFQVPNGDTLVIDCANLPIIQPRKGLPWIIDMEDITGTTVQVDALFIKN